MSGKRSARDAPMVPTSRQELDIKKDGPRRRVPAAAAAAAAAEAAGALAPHHHFDARRMLTSAFGAASCSGVTDLMARAVCDPSKEDIVDALPPTLAHPDGLHLSNEEDLETAKATIRFEEDWRSTLLIGALPSLVSIDPKSVGATSLEAALISRCVAGAHGDGAARSDETVDDDDSVTIECAGTVCRLSRAVVLDVIFRWRRAGGNTNDAPPSLMAVVSCALNPAGRTADTANNMSQLASRDKYQPTAVFLKPMFLLPSSALSSIDDTLESGAAPMELVLIRACCLYTQSIHVRATWSSVAVGTEMPLPRMYTNHLEDEFMRHLLTPRAVSSDLSIRAAHTTHAAELRVDASPFLAKAVKADAERIRTVVCQGRSSRVNDPLRAPHRDKFMSHSEFSACVALADATLRDVKAPDTGAAPQWRCIRGTPITLAQAIGRLARTPVRCDRLIEFWRSGTLPRPESWAVLLAFDAHASLGLAVLKRALHTMTASLRALKPELGVWYTCIPYMRHDIALPGYVVVAERSAFMAANALYGMNGNDRLECLVVQPMHCPTQAKAYELWNSVSLYNDRELRDFGSDWPTLTSDTGEYYPKGLSAAITELSTALRKYMCVTDTAIAERIAREASALS